MKFSTLLLMSRQFRLPTFVLCLGVLAGCVSDQAVQSFGPYEQFRPPKGLFPPMTDKRSRALASVSYYFKAGKEKFLTTPHLTFKVLAYFEWLLNDVKSEPSLNKQRFVKILDAREEIRAALGLSAGLSSREAINQYYSMSKFMVAVGQFETGGETQAVKRRKAISSLKLKLTDMLKRDDIQPSRNIPPNQASVPSSRRQEAFHAVGAPGLDDTERRRMKPST